MKTTKATPATYIRAESDRQFGVVAKMAGGVNRFYHFRRLTPLDKQNVVRMNRDTLYSMGMWIPRRAPRSPSLSSRRIGMKETRSDTAVGRE